MAQNYQVKVPTAERIIQIVASSHREAAEKVLDKIFRRLSADRVAVHVDDGETVKRFWGKPDGDVWGGWVV